MYQNLRGNTKNPKQPNPTSSHSKAAVVLPLETKMSRSPQQLIGFFRNKAVVPRGSWLLLSQNRANDPLPFQLSVFSPTPEAAPFPQIFPSQPFPQPTDHTHTTSLDNPPHFPFLLTTSQREPTFSFTFYLCLAPISLSFISLLPPSLFPRSPPPKAK